MTNIFSAAQPSELQGVSPNKNIAGAAVGGKVWIDRDYVFEDIPSLLVGLPFFQMPIVVREDTTMTIRFPSHQPSTSHIHLIQLTMEVSIVVFPKMDGYTNKVELKPPMFI